MTEQTRRNVLRYGIAIDLVIMATGVGLLVPATATLLVGAFAAAVALSAWKGGWQGALTAFLLSLVALLVVFNDLIDFPHLTAFAAISVAATALVMTLTRPRIAAPALVADGLTEPVAVPIEDEHADEAEAAAAPHDAFAQKPLERSTLAEVVPLHREPEPASGKRSRRKKRHEARGVAERSATDHPAEHDKAAADAERARAEEMRVAAEAEAERVRLEQERRAAEAEVSRREEEARLAAEAERARIEEERRAAEAAEAARRHEEARIAAEAERARIEDEARRAAEAAEAKRRQEEEARLAAEAERARMEEERRAAEAAEAKRRQEEEARLAAEAERARIEQVRLAAEAEAARRREEAARLAAEAEAERLRAEEERRAIEVEAARRREEAARLAAEAEEQRRRAEAARRAAEEEAARVAAEAEAARRRTEAERARLAKELDERLAREREEAQRALEARIAEERRIADETAARTRAEAERLAAEAEVERQRAEEDRRRAEQERLRAAQEAEAAFAIEREAKQRELQERLESERRTAEEELRRQLESERGAMRARMEQELAAEREKLAAERAATAAPASAKPPQVTSVAKASSLLDTVTGWFRREPRPRAVNLKTKRLPTNGNTTATRRPSSATPSNGTRRTATGSAHQQSGASSKPRLLMIERRRGTADTVVPKLRHRGVEVEVVERWVDAVDEIFRFRPDALCLDVEHPELDRIHRTLTEKSSQLPVILTGRSTGSPPALRHAAFIVRPYDVDELTRLAQKAHASPDDLLAEQTMPRQAKPIAPAAVAHPSRPIAVAAPSRPVGVPRPAPAPAAISLADVHGAVDEHAALPSPDGRTSGTDDYEVTCFSCRAGFNAVDADWCSCLAKERTLVCTNCLACFCKAPPAYKEKFWVEAPPRLFERKTSDARRQQSMLPANLAKEQVTRPLVLSVEDDEEIQAIVQRVCSNLGYGFVWATNGQDGLELAHEYKPNLILSDAFMPKLDGREMCRMLKEDPAHADCRMVVMTGLYTDTKYRSEAVKRFHVDDYIAKPVAITDLINLLQRHLEGVSGLPAQEDLHELHRAQLDELAEPPESVDATSFEDDVPLADVLTMPASVTGNVPVARPRGDFYEVCCFNCQNNFDAARAEWCRCVGRDNTLLCEHCGGCFCKAPAAYRERFWIDAPPSLFERKMIGSKRNVVTRLNPAPEEVKRPLILLVEDDENVQLIVRTVVSSMGYGFVVGANGQEGLSLAREYNPDLILSDAFMPKLDGREMCRLLKEDPSTSRSKAIIMTGLYTDRKYRNEALDYFKVDDYVAKPLAVDDLIKLFKKHLPQEAAIAH